MKFLSKILPAIIGTALFLGWPIHGHGANISILVGSGGSRFVPAATNINVNDQVIWSWASFNHNVTSLSNPPSWTASATMSSGTFSNTFTVPGSYPYECTIHAGVGMLGSVTVIAPNQPPTVSITNPANGTVLAAPANLTIKASASDSDGSVTNVQFLVGSAIVSNVTTSPFVAITNNLAAGSYTLSAIASDNLGAKNTNSVSLSVVTPVAVAFTNAAKTVGTNFQFSYAANVGLSYVIQRSTNLAPANWIPVITNVAASNPVVFVDIKPTNNSTFYRVGRMPNP